MKFILYILKSLKNSKFYVGHTNDLERRIKEHNSGQTNRPVSELVYRNDYKYELVDGLYPDDTDKIQIDFETSYY